MKENSLKDVLAALNSGELSMDQLLENLDTKTAYVRRGSSFAVLKYESVSQINGEFAKVYTLASEKIERDGKPVERKPRKKAEANGA